MWTVGVIGVGSFGQKRVQTLLELDDLVTAVHIVDSNRDLVDKTINSLSSPRLFAVDSIEDFFHHPDINVICICTPNHLHAEYSLLALQNNKHVLCEKPITTETTVAKSLLSAAKKHQRLIKVGTNHRFFPSVQAALELHNSGVLGQLHSMHASIGTNGERIQNTWFWQKKLAGGGTLLDNGHHLLDLAQLFCGPFATCIGHASTRRWKQAEVEDYAVAIFEGKSSKNHSGCEAVLRSSWRQPSGYLELELWYSKGSIKISVNQREEMTTQIGKEVRHLDFTDHPKTSLHQEMRDFLTACDEPLPHLKDASLHLLTLTKMISGFYTSHLSGQRIEL